MNQTICIIWLTSSVNGNNEMVTQKLKNKIFLPIWIWTAIPWNRKPECYQWAMLTLWWHIICYSQKPRDREYCFTWLSQLWTAPHLVKGLTPLMMTPFILLSSAPINSSPPKYQSNLQKRNKIRLVKLKRNSFFGGLNVIYSPIIDHT